MTRSPQILHNLLDVVPALHLLYTCFNTCFTPQILHNLLGNASKFTTKGTVGLRVEVDRSGDYVVLAVIISVTPRGDKHTYQKYRGFGGAE